MKTQRLCRPFEVRHMRDCHVDIIARDVTVPPDWSMQCFCRLRAVSHHVDSPVRLDRLPRCKIRKIASWCSKRQKWSSLFSPREVFNSTEFTKDVIERFLMLVDRGRKYWKPSGVFKSCFFIAGQLLLVICWKLSSVREPTENLLAACLRSGEVGMVSLWWKFFIVSTFSSGNCLQIVIWCSTTRFSHLQSAFELHAFKCSDC